MEDTEGLWIKNANAISGLSQDVHNSTFIKK